MLKNSILALLLFCCFTGAYAQTNVSGGIYSDVTWSLANSPYIVTSDIVVFPGKTLTIEPGVEVRVQGTLFTGSGGITIEVRGKMIAVGTAMAPITFKADGIITDPWTWKGILVKSSQGGDCEIDYVHMSNMVDGFRADSYPTVNDTVQYNNCVFTDNSFALSVFRPTILNNCTFANNGLALTGSSLPTLGIFNCDFDSNATALGYIYHNVMIDGCNFRGNRDGLIANNPGTVTNCFFQGNETGVQGIGYALSNCTFLNNQTAVGYLEGGSVTNCIINNNNLGVDLRLGGILVNSEVRNNVVGVKIWDPNVTFSDNRICGNMQYNVENAADKNISLVDNCFCESDSTVAEALLFDGYDDISRGLFNYALYDSSCTNIVQLVSKVNIVTGIDPSQATGLEIFPNPAQDLLQVKMAETNAQGTLSVLSLQGQVLRRLPAASLTQIDVAELAAGIYLLEYQGETREVQKWIKR